MEYTTSQAIADSLVIYGIVIVVSLLVAVVIRLIVWTLSRKAEQIKTAAPAKPAAMAPPPVATAHGLPQDHFAAIAAAVAAMMGAHRIVRIETAGQGYSWTATARSAHHLSHAPRK
ncbi:MAG: hypothetical protein R6X17_05025 [Candidatus Competibacteraceae bacterium]